MGAEAGDGAGQGFTGFGLAPVEAVPGFTIGGLVAAVVGTTVDGVGGIGPVVVGGVGATGTLGWLVAEAVAVGPEGIGRDVGSVDPM